MYPSNNTFKTIKQIGYLNPKVSLILHTESQHERWKCEGCSPVFQIVESELPRRMYCTTCDDYGHDAQNHEELKDIS